MRAERPCSDLNKIGLDSACRKHDRGSSRNLGLDHAFSHGYVQSRPRRRRLRRHHQRHHDRRHHCGRWPVQPARSDHGGQSRFRLQRLHGRQWRRLDHSRRGRIPVRYRRRQRGRQCQWRSGCAQQPEHCRSRRRRGPDPRRSRGPRVRSRPARGWSDDRGRHFRSNHPQWRRRAGRRDTQSRGRRPERFVGVIHRQCGEPGCRNRLVRPA